MPRKKRLIRPNVRYRIKTRCHHGFWESEDPEIESCFERVFTSLRRSGYHFRIHQLRVLDNGYLLEITPNAATPINQIMQLINSLAARRLNRYFGNCGTLWRSRYSSEIVEGSVSFLNCTSKTSPIEEARDT